MRPALVRYTKDRSYKNLEQPKQSSETRTAQRAWRAKSEVIIDSRLDGLHGFGVRILIESLDNILFIYK